MKYIYTKAFKGQNEAGEVGVYFQPCVTMKDENGDICYGFIPNGILEMFENSNLIDLQLSNTYVGCNNPVIVELSDEIYENLNNLLIEFNNQAIAIAQKMRDEMGAIESLMMDNNEKESTAMMYVLHNIHNRMSNTFLNKDCEIVKEKISIYEEEDCEEFEDEYDEDSYDA